jgi:Protein of unknown function (DUF2924)
MIETAPTSAITALVHSLPTLPKERLVELWNENFGKAPGRIRPELMRPILAFRIQERAYGGLSTETKDRLRQVMESLEPQRRSQGKALLLLHPHRLWSRFIGERHQTPACGRIGEPCSLQLVRFLKTPRG